MWNLFVFCFGVSFYGYIILSGVNDCVLGSVLLLGAIKTEALSDVAGEVSSFVQLFIVI